MSIPIDTMKQSVQLWLASVLRGLFVAATTWLSSHYPQTAKILNIPEAAFPWIATLLSVALVSSLSVWLTSRRYSATTQNIVRESVSAAELVVTKKSEVANG
jgi:hypothetical protein